MTVRPVIDMGETKEYVDAVAPKTILRTIERKTNKHRLKIGLN